MGSLWQANNIHCRQNVKLLPANDQPTSKIFPRPRLYDFFQARVSSDRDSVDLSRPNSYFHLRPPRGLTSPSEVFFLYRWKNTQTSRAVDSALTLWSSLSIQFKTLEYQVAACQDPNTLLPTAYSFQRKYQMIRLGPVCTTGRLACLLSDELEFEPPRFYWIQGHADHFSSTFSFKYTEVSGKCNPFGDLPPTFDLHRLFYHIPTQWLLLQNGTSEVLGWKYLGLSAGCQITLRGGTVRPRV